MSSLQPHIHSDIEHSNTTAKTEQLYSDTRSGGIFIRLGPGGISGPFSAKSKSWSEDTLSASDGSSDSSSQTSSSDYSTTTLEQSASQDYEPISYAVAEAGRSTFGYWKIESSRVPKGWSNDPRQFTKIRNTPFFEYDLTPVLASDAATTPRRYLMSYSGHFYFWIPSTPELLYVTQCYSLEGILQRISGGYELQTKSLDPLAPQYNQLHDNYLSLWFWQIPYGWSQDVQELEDLKDIILGQEYGLPPLIPILVRDPSSESTEYFIKSGEEFYLFYHISCQLVHIDKPSGLHEILSVLGPGLGKELETTDVNLLPEYGGPNIVADDNVPLGWSNKIDKAVSCAELFYKHRIFSADLLLFWDGGQTDTPMYLVEGMADHYIWDTTPNGIWRIDKAQGLQDILDILNDESRHLRVSRVLFECPSKVSQLAGETELVIRRSQNDTKTARETLPVTVHPSLGPVRLVMGLATHICGLHTLR